MRDFFAKAFLPFKIRYIISVDSQMWFQWRSEQKWDFHHTDVHKTHEC